MIRISDRRAPWQIKKPRRERRGHLWLLMKSRLEGALNAQLHSHVVRITLYADCSECSRASCADVVGDLGVIDFQASACQNSSWLIAVLGLKFAPARQPYFSCHCHAFSSVHRVAVFLKLFCWHFVKKSNTINNVSNTEIIRLLNIYFISFKICWERVNHRQEHVSINAKLLQWSSYV